MTIDLQGHSLVIREEAPSRILGALFDNTVLPARGMNFYCKALSVIPTGEVLPTTLYIPSSKELVWVDDNGAFQAFHESDGSFKEPRKAQVSTATQIKADLNQLFFSEAPAEDPAGIDRYTERLNKALKKGLIVGRGFDSLIGI